MSVRPSSKVWFAAGASLAISGGFAILMSLPAGGATLWAGIGLIALGSLALRRGLDAYQPDPQRRVERAEDEQARSVSDRVEPELRGPVPRRVALTGRGKSIVITWTVTLAVFASLAHQHFGRLPPPPEKNMLELDGEGSTATVHSRDARILDNGNTLYRVGYGFSTEAGIPIRISRTVPPRVFDSLQDGETMQVTYLPANPEVHYLPAITSPVSTRFVFFIGGLLLAAAGFAEAQRRFHRRLVMGGTPVSGFTADVRRRGGVRSFRVNYNVNGERQTLKGTERNPDLRSGQAATVLYNPFIPTRAVIYRLALYKARN